MNNFFLSEQSEKYLKKRTRHQRWLTMVGCMAVVVTLGTVAALKFNGQAKSYKDKVLQCAYQVHEHTRDCYDDDYENLICGYADYVVHTHNDDCYAAGELVCPLSEVEEHTHDADCYTERERRVCGQDESSGHMHGDSCYSTERGGLICGWDEHSHSDGCYEYNDETGESVLACGMDEHWHSDDCYDWYSVLTCGMEEGSGAHYHDSSCYEIRTVLTCEKLELHTHDKNKCYDEYDNLTCRETVLEEHVHTGDCFRVIDRAAYEEEPVETEAPEETEPASDEPAENASGEASEEASAEPMLQKVFEDESIRVTAAYTEAAGIPEEAELVVSIVDSGERYNQRVEEASALLSGQESAARFLYNIAFVLDGEEIEPAGTVNITFQIFDDSLQGSTSVTVIHYGDEQPVIVEDSALEQSEEGGIAASFATDSFSDFLLVIGTPEPVEETPEPVDWTENGAYLLADTFTYETDDFTISFLVDGVVTAAKEEAPSDASGEIEPVGEIDEETEPEAEPTEETEPAAEAAEEITEPEPEAEPETEPAAEPVEAEEITEALDGELVELQVTLLDENAAAYNEILTAAEESSENELLSLSVLELGFSYDGVALDMSACNVIAQITPRASLLDTVDMDEPEDVADTTVCGPILSVLMEGADGVQEADSMVVPLESEYMPVMTLSVEGSYMAMALNEPENPSFTVQYWANLARPVDGGTSGLPFINTSTGNGNGDYALPVNGNKNLNTTNIALDGKGTFTIATESVLTKIFEKETYHYFQAPRLMYFDILADSSSYTLKEIWVRQPAAVALAEEAEDAGIAVLSEEATAAQTEEAEEAPETGIAVLAEEAVALQTEAEENWDVQYTNPALVTFTNNPNAVDENTVLIQEGTVIRLVYDTVKGSHNNAAAFFDYDITDGKLHKSNNAGSSYYMSYERDKALSAWGKVYADARKQGINSNSNYSGSGTIKLAFGQSNTGMDFATVYWGNNQLNKYNNNSYEGCTFGLVTGLDANGNLIYASGITAPKLFSEGSATGKTQISGWSLNFTRDGDTYVLQAVNGAATATGLDTFNHPVYNGNPYNHIFSNNFWPMDSAKTWGTETDGIYHDVKFGSAAVNGKIIGIGTSEEKRRTFPPSDDGQDHNSYFGMQYALTFEYDENYVGPLEYYFYGDDDMWAFLDGKLICDIGGVHSSVGEYVNLWNHLDRERDAGKTHTLSIFYTERGASGSTCYMRFTLPSVSSVTPTMSNGTLRVEKAVDGPLGAGKENTEFEFTLNLTSANGNSVTNNYPYAIYNKNGIQQSSGSITSGGIFQLQKGWYIVIDYLPVGTKYSVTEATADWYATTVTVDGADTTAASGSITGQHQSKVVFTNHTSYELPHTGGEGTVIFAIAGAALLVSIAGIRFASRRKTRRGDC